MTGRERSVFVRVTDAVVAPVPPLPPVRETDAAAAFERSLKAAPRLNALALRAVFLLVGAGLRRGPLLKLVRSLAHLHYYGDAGVMRVLGYDADAVVARAADVRGR
ncbi:MAG: hypothetical protein E6G41_15640 [Actinobacteria bacterium]|nr:MAG: hypothetical protein E6G41_15640 [Actinomycetota bacterium]